MATPKNYKLIDKIVELNNNNFSIKEITSICSKEFNMKESAIKAYFYRYNIKGKMHHKLLMTDDYFNIIDTQEKAYLLGFFIADGCIGLNSNCKNSFYLSLNLTQKDIEIINFYKNELGIKNVITTSNYKAGAINRKSTVMLKWTSTKMKEVLTNKYQIKSRKTFDNNFKFPFEHIPQELIRHFIRGYFDGDGCISYSNLKNFKFLIYSTSKLFLEQISEIFIKQFKIDFIIRGKKTKNVELFELSFSSNQKRRYFINEVYKWFYNDSSFFLNRKKVKFEKYLNTVLT